MFETACAMGLEGFVSKRSDSRYISDRTDVWLKMTCRQRETLSVVGYAMKESRFDGLIVGRREGDELIYAGKVDHGFTPGIATDVRKRLAPRAENPGLQLQDQEAECRVGETSACRRGRLSGEVGGEQATASDLQGLPGGFVMRDPETLAAAVLDIETILSDYLEPGPRDADGTITAILERLDRDDVPTAAERVRDGFGRLHVIR